MSLERVFSIIIVGVIGLAAFKFFTTGHRLESEEAAASPPRTVSRSVVPVPTVTDSKIPGLNDQPNAVSTPPAATVSESVDVGYAPEVAAFNAAGADFMFRKVTADFGLDIAAPFTFASYSLSSDDKDSVQFQATSASESESFSLIVRLRQNSMSSLDRFYQDNEVRREAVQREVLPTGVFAQFTATDRSLAAAEGRSAKGLPFLAVWSKSAPLTSADAAKIRAYLTVTK